MITAAVDTNAILRYLVNDIPSQHEAVTKRFQEARAGKIKLVVFSFTVAETVYILEGWYKKSKQETVELLLAFFSPTWIKMENKEAVISALSLYNNSSVDFTDALLLSSCSPQDFRILSFDKHFDKLSPKLRLEP